MKFHTSWVCSPKPLFIPISYTWVGPYTPVQHWYTHKKWLYNIPMQHKIHDFNFVDEPLSHQNTIDGKISMGLLVTGYYSTCCIRCHTNALHKPTNTPSKNFEPPLLHQFINPFGPNVSQKICTIKFLIHRNLQNQVGSVILNSDFINHFGPNLS